jgi:5-methylcytosine-specific restriction endonuclease McrBC regulatory subunit McrC
VGSIPLLDGRTLRIRPKVGEVNFLRLLLRAEGNQRRLERLYEEYVHHDVGPVAGIVSVVARSLMSSVDMVIRMGLAVQRKATTSRGNFFAGAVNASTTAFNIAARTSDPVLYRHRQRCLDTEEHRLLGNATRYAWRFLAAEDRAVFQRAYRYWARYATGKDDLASDLAAVERRFAAGNYRGPRSYYARALMLARVLLGSLGIGALSDQHVAADAFLLNSADVFERYARRVVDDGHSDAGYVVSKGGPSITTLYQDGTHVLEPDIVMSRGRTVELIADVKYKTPDSSDHYQLITYMTRFGARVGALLSAASGSEVVQKREHQMDGGVRVWVVYLPMGNLEATEEFLASLIERLY